jgi:parallel beta-helix repeat protein
MTLPLPVDSPPPAYTATVKVKDTAGLNTALKFAKPGSAILLAPGRYDGVRVDQIKVQGVTITSEDPKSPAILTRFYITNSSGLTFSNLVFTTEGSDDPYPFRLRYATGVTLVNLSVHGSMDGNPQNDQSGLWLGDCEHITIRNSEFQELANGIVHGNSSDILIDGNYIHNIAIDGIHGGGTSNITISNNHMADFHVLDGQHPDAIQFWTVNTTESATNITITGNLAERGTGTMLQGVFMGNEASHTYKNVTISNNTVVGGMYNGIAIGDGDGITVTGNTVLQFDGQPSWIVMRYVKNATASGNTVSQLSYVESKPKEANNKIISTPKDKGASAIAAWKAAHPAIAGLLAK